MVCRNFFLTGCLALASLLSGAALAQVGVAIEVPHREFVLYEPLMVQVNLLNSTGKNVVFHENEQWLEFFIVRERVDLIPATGSPLLSKDVFLEAASTTGFKVNLTYTYELREPGNYEVQAKVRHKGHTYTSAAARFKLVNGAVQWKQRFVFTNPKSNQEEMRDYELVAQQMERGNRLLARIRDPKGKKVMCCTPVGDLLGYGEPSVKVDSGGTLHVLNQTAPRQFVYSKISPEGIREKPRAFLSVGGQPSLIETAEEGVLVVGGTEIGDDGRALTFERPGMKAMPVPAKAAPAAQVEKKEEEEDD